LPQLLRDEPEIVTTLEGIIAHQLPRRDEFARLADEFAKQQHFDLTQQLGLLRDEMNLRLDRQFDLLHEEMEQRFESQREEIELLREEVKLLRVEMDRRFEQVDQRFEQAHHDHLDIKRRVIKVESSQETLIKKVSGLETWLKFVTGNLGTEKGQTLEDMFAVALRYGLNNSDIAPESIQLRQDLVDTEGVVFKKNYVTEVDLIAEDGKFIVFEVKATAKRSDVDFFGLKVELVQAQNPNQPVQGVFISGSEG